MTEGRLADLARVRGISTVDEMERGEDVAVIRDVAGLRAAVRGFRGAGERVALIPTMGALHEGHLTLVRAGRERARRTIVSIFVNPTQFGPNEDVDRYPRQEAQDLRRLAEIGADIAYLPSAASMYPPGFATAITVGGVSEGLCGAVRPGHFAGVATVVAKLLLQALPDIALFGEKDYQQLQVIRRLVRDLDIPVEVQGVPTIREPDGLALSSRNVYLAPEDRARAPRLYAALRRIAAEIETGAEPAGLIAGARRELDGAGFGPIEYLELRDADTLARVERLAGPARLLVAAYLGTTRLIDNVPVVPQPA